MGRRPQKLELTWFNKDKALIPTETGKYGYTWVDPRDPRYCETHTLIYGETVVGTQAPKEDGRTYSDRADLEPTDDNLLIKGESGDVLEALTRVPELAEKYVGKVKCIYIDPPFNTAQTFANYEDNLEHSIWLTMMRDRLLHLRKLLSDDGSIWVHLDDIENHRMRVLMDEVFGPGKFYGQIAWQNGLHVRNDSSSFSSNNDTIITYAKSSVSINKLPPTPEMISRYSSPDGDPILWQSVASAAPGAKTHQGMVYGIQHPISGEMMYPPRGRCWTMGQDAMLRTMNQWSSYSLKRIDDEEIRADICGVSSGELRADVMAIVLDLPLEESSKLALDVLHNGVWPEFFFTGSDGRGGLRKKSYLPVDYGRVPSTVWLDAGRNDEAKREIQALFPDESAFTTPKPERLLERIIHISTNPGDIVLDVFAGSGTTAAVAHKMGRRWVTCELVEDTLNRFTRPRLEKVVRGEDPGGITLTTGERVDATEEGLPEGLTAEEAQKLTSLLNKAIRESDELKRSKDIRSLKARVKTRKYPDTINWRGGGGFRTARLAPSCFDYDPDLGLVLLTAAASGKVLVDSIAANLNFRLTPEHRHFDGVRGSMRLAVVEGRLDRRKVDDLISHLAADEGLTIAATEIEDGVRQYIRSLGRGCRAVHVPDDIFSYSEED